MTSKVTVRRAERTEQDSIVASSIPVSTYFRGGTRPMGTKGGFSGLFLRHYSGIVLLHRPGKTWREPDLNVMRIYDYDPRDVEIIDSPATGKGE